ncbi:MAG: hydrogenase maturation protease [Acidimicrobiia bacterium]
MAEQAVICVGNRARTDDGVGPVIADELSARGLDIAVHITGGEPAELIDLWSGLDRVVIVDAVLTGHSAPGTVHLISASHESIDLGTQASTHGLGLAESIELGRSLNQLPAEVQVVGIEASDLTPGTGLTPAVEASVPAAVATVLSEVSRA